MNNPTFNYKNAGLDMNNPHRTPYSFCGDVLSEDLLLGHLESIFSFNMCNRTYS